jgi:hypothetical protein
MFLEGKKVEKAPANPLAVGAPSTPPPTTAEDVVMVSFDLDDTLWPGKTVINNANE